MTSKATWILLKIAEDHLQILNITDFEYYCCLLVLVDTITDTVAVRKLHFHVFWSQKSKIIYYPSRAINMHVIMYVCMSVSCVCLTTCTCIHVWCEHQKGISSILNFRNDMRTALASGDYQTLLEFLTTTFGSFSEMVAVFKVWYICMSLLTYSTFSQGGLRASETFLYL